MIKNFLKTLGPGLIMAGAAVGVSHLVQSTRAGAMYGYTLIALILITNILKYPFFEYGHRYAYATGENLLQGLEQIGPNTLKIFVLTNIITGITANAGIFLVCAGLVETLMPFQFAHDTILYAGLIFICLVGLIYYGEFSLFDNVMKVMMVILSITTFAAFIMAYVKNDQFAGIIQVNNSPWNYASLAFLLALMGWMPAPIEVSTWQSLWCQEKTKYLVKNKISFNYKWAMNDFRLGYILTIILALIFLSLGAIILYPKQIILSDSAVGFSTQVISLFTQTLGQWAYPIICLACLSTMVSTAVTCLDGYSRSFQKGIELILKKTEFENNNKKFKLYSLLLFSIPSYCILVFLGHKLKFLIDFITIVSFLAGPIFAYFNFKIIQLDKVPQHLRPNVFYKIWSWLGLVFLSGLGILYISFLIS